MDDRSGRVAQPQRERIPFLHAVAAVEGRSDVDRMPDADRVLQARHEELPERQRERRPRVLPAPVPRAAKGPREDRAGPVSQRSQGRLALPALTRERRLPPSVACASWLWADRRKKVLVQAHEPLVLPEARWVL